MAKFEESNFCIGLNIYKEILKFDKNWSKNDN